MLILLACLAFQRLVDRFNNTVSLNPEQRNGSRLAEQEQINKAEKFFMLHPDARMRSVKVAERSSKPSQTQCCRFDASLTRASGCTMKSS